MRIKGKKILITGGAGFIGSNLSGALGRLNAKVDIFDKNNGLSILDSGKLKKYISRKYDAIYHLAGFSGSLESNENRETCLKINTIATLELFELISHYSPKTHVILSNSRLEYGRPQYLPVGETHPTLPLSAYGLSKLLITQLAEIYEKEKKLKYTVFRTSNVYGPHKKETFLGYNLLNFYIDQAKSDKDLVIFGDGEQLRDYLYIEDLVNAFILALEKDAHGQVYNLGSGIGISLKKMAKLITKTIGKGKILRKPWPQDLKSIETGSYVSDISKISKELGFHPRVNFATGIRKSI